MAAPPVPFMPLPFPFPAPIPAAKAPQRTEGPSDPQKTLYVQNLNEKVKLDALKRDLRAAFSVHGEVLQVYCKKSVKMRGQAFVVFKEQESADRAKDELQYFPLHGKPMNIQYAKIKSDDTAKLEGTLEESKKMREARKAAEPKPEPLKVSKPDPMDVGSDDEDATSSAKRKAPDATQPKAKKVKASAPAAPSAANPFPFGYYPGYYPGAPPPGMPAQEFEVPNSTLFLQNLPAGTTQEALQGLFQQYPGLKEVRMVPGKSDLAFVEYTDESQAAVAKNALNGFKMAPEKEIRVTFAKR
ncbi:RNA-binding domain-containing protein [Gonapodya prolifera JEL478]|uniref:RNA-binding domain-containing protein n=1 Tax=Gonapodya prolifera (strain JEL478) TaxID=1344416 RepID=A0A139AAL4_GONPJ|nr:RNA-binding domain-containing protein [Gonapodya prolifera JEL478]|eukprot:KXS13780.1 RNA-binding domain-containing protein [Gonapodya prolifera JEL478]